MYTTKYALFSTKIFQLIPPLILPLTNVARKFTVVIKVTEPTLEQQLKYEYNNIFYHLN